MAINTETDAGSINTGLMGNVSLVRDGKTEVESSGLFRERFRGFVYSNCPLSWAEAGVLLRCGMWTETRALTMEMMLRWAQWPHHSQHTTNEMFTGKIANHR